MLVLTRKFGESIVLGDDIKVTVVKIENGQVRLGIDAPKHVTILREELAPNNHPLITKTPKE